MNSEILRELYARYEKEIYLYLFALCKNREVAKDLTQDTFLKALLSLSDSHSNMRAWLYVVARNEYYNYYSKYEKRKMDLSINQEDDSYELENIVDENVKDMADGMIEDMQKRLLYKAISHLTNEKREVILLQYFSELSQKEIAALMRKSPENIRVLSHRAKLELRKYMEEMER